MEIFRNKILENVSFKCMDKTSFVMVKAVLMMKALLKDSTSALTIHKLGLFIHFKHNFTLILFPKVSMGYICMIPGFFLHCKALEHSPLIYVEANSHLCIVAPGFRPGFKGSMFNILALHLQAITQTL